MHKLLFAAIILLFAASAAAIPDAYVLHQINSSHWYFETSQNDLVPGDHTYQAFANNKSTELRTLTYPLPDGLHQINATHWCFKVNKTELSYGTHNYQAFANNISSDYMVLDVDIGGDCTRGDICANTSGWWRAGGALNTSATPIQAAVDNATAGETVYVWNGTYTENVDISTAHLTLVGEGRDVVVVTAASTADHVFDVQQDYVNVSGFTVMNATGSNKGGIYLLGRHHCTISDNNITSNFCGAYLLNSYDNTITNNTASSNGQQGFRLRGSTNNTLNNNTGNSNGVTGIYLRDSRNNTLTNNTAASNTQQGIYLFSLCNNNTITNNTLTNNTQQGIFVWSSNNNTLTNNTATLNAQQGIYLRDSTHNTLNNNTGNSNGVTGIYLRGASNNTLTNNTANSNGQQGIYLFFLNSNNTITDNTASNNSQQGILVWSSSNNTFTNNTVTSNSQQGIYLRDSSNNTFTKNNASSNSQQGIYLRGASTTNHDNTIYNNYFNNTNNAYDAGNNIWNITPVLGTNIMGGSHLGGNYWSDYAGVDLTGDDLGDTLTPYNSGITNGGDYHPLVQVTTISYIPPDPINIANTTGNFWINHTWSAGTGTVTDSYNVSVNQTWHNTTTNTYWNNTGLSAHGWSNITVYAWNNSAGGNLSTGNISQDTQIPNNLITITNTSDWSGDAGANVYVDYDATDLDSDTPTFSCNRTDLFTDFDTATGTGNWTAATGTYYVDFGVSDGWGSTSNYTMLISVGAPPPEPYIPPDPTSLVNTTGNFWINHTWAAGTGNVTDSYNVSVNQTWHNTTTNTYWNNTGLSAHGWSNITVYAWNNSAGGNLSAGNISQNTQIPNNDPSAGSPQPINGGTGVSTSPTLQVTVTDLDLDNMSVRFYEQGGSQIGSTQTNITSGSTASVIWSGRSTSTTYHWYVVTNDTYNETTSTVWHFTTQSGGGPTHQVTIEDCNNRQTTEGGEIYNDFNYTNDDPDVPVFTTNATEGSLDSGTGVYNWTTSGGDAGVYVWWFRATNAYGNHDTCTVTFTVTSSNVQPPTNLQHTTGNFWVRHTWTPGANTDTYNISVNSVWHNSTTNEYWNNTPMSPHAWSNISIAGYNTTNNNISSFISQNTQIPNNPITITNTSDWSGDIGENVYVDYDSTDADSDTPTYSCSRTDLFTDFNPTTGTGNWTPATNGTYHVDFGVSDGYGSTSNHTMTIHVGVSGGITTKTTIPMILFIALTIILFFATGYIFHAKTHISRIFTTLIATWMAFMLSQMIVSGNVVQMSSALNSADVWTHDTVAIQIPGLSYLLLFIAVILSIFLVKFVIMFGLEVIREAQKEKM